MSDPLDLDQLLYDAEQGWALSTEARVALAAEVRRLRATVSRVKSAVANHPTPCPEVDVDAGISCGWKRAFVDVRSALKESKP